MNVTARVHPRPWVAEKTPPAAVSATEDHDAEQQTSGKEREARTVALLIRAGRVDDPGIASQLRGEAVALNLRLVRGVARRYAGRGVELEDLQQVAGMALVLAARRFEPEQGRGFGAFAQVTMHGELKRHLRDHAWAVRPPRALHDTYLQIVRIGDDLAQSLQAVPSTGQIAQALGVTSQQVREAQNVSGSYAAASLDAWPGGDDIPWGEPVNVGRVRSVDAQLAGLDLRQSIRLLPPREQLMLHLRFAEDLTQQQIGVRLGISQMQVSRQLSSVIARLRATLTNDTAEAAS
ncbi:sigma-70 family RNA polymerase sigma factor [Allobranchiibius huperziae]|nr:sigma-70 family RNA polymerase sigma factor [Allobranchiibius huperziae]